MTIVAAVARTKDSRSTVEEGRRLAEAFEDKLHVVHVLSEEEFYELDRVNVERKHTTVQNREIEEAATNIAEEAAEDDLSNVTPIGLMGSAADEIIRYSQEVDAQYIVIGSRKRSPVGKAVFGSVTQSVLLNADQTVVAVHHR